MKLHIILACLTAAITMNTHATDESDTGLRQGDALPDQTPAEIAGAKKVAAAIKADKARGFKPTKAFDDIVGADTPETTKRQVYREIERLEWTLAGVTDQAAVAALRKSTLEQIAKLVPGVRIERLGKLLTLKKTDLRQP